MAKVHVEHAIYTLKGSTDCRDDIIALNHAMWKSSIGPTHNGLKANEIESEVGVSLKHDPVTVLDHLVDIGHVKRDPEDYDDLRSFAIAEWKGSDGDIVNGEVDEAVDEAIQALIRHVHDTDPSPDESGVVADGGTVSIRSVLASELDPSPAAIESWLRDGDELKNLNKAVEAIEEHPDVNTRDDYGAITFRNEAYRYSLTDDAVKLYRR